MTEAMPLGVDPCQRRNLTNLMTQKPWSLGHLIVVGRVMAFYRSRRHNSARLHLRTRLLHHNCSFSFIDFFSIFITPLIYSKKMPDSKFRKLTFFSTFWQSLEKIDPQSILALSLFPKSGSSHRSAKLFFLIFNLTKKVIANRTFPVRTRRRGTIKRNLGWPYAIDKITATFLAFLFVGANNTGGLDKFF